MRYFTAFIFFFISSLNVNGQKDDLSLLVKKVNLDKNKTESREYDAFLDINKEFYSGSFYFGGTTFPTPFSPAYYWSLFLEDTTKIEVSLTDDKGNLIARKFNKRLDPGVYRVEVDGLYGLIKQSSFFYIEAKSETIKKQIKFFYWDSEVLSPSNVFVINDLESSTIFNDSLTLKPTIDKKTKVHLEGWILNVPLFGATSFKLFSDNDTLPEFYHSAPLDAGLYEILLDSSVAPGKYRLVIESYDAKLEKVFTLIR